MPTRKKLPILSSPDIDSAENHPPKILNKELLAQELPLEVPPLIASQDTHRRRLPNERQAITHKFSVNDQEVYLTVGLFEDGTPGEIFITLSKQGSTLSGLVDAFSTAVSVALQYKVPLEVFVNKFSNTQFEPSGVTSNPEIRTAKSIVSYIFTWMNMKFLGGTPLAIQVDSIQEKTAPLFEVKATKQVMFDAIGSAPGKDSF